MNFELISQRGVARWTIGAFALAITAWLGAAPLAMAQSGARDLAPPPQTESLLPPAPSIDSDGSGTRNASPTLADTPIASDTDGTLSSIDDATTFGSEYLFDPSAPAVTESSGTFLRRGWWYGRSDLVFLQRTWASSRITLATDSPTTPFGIPVSGRSLMLRNSSPGREEGARLTLGRFLFRDIHNRDHTAEFTYFGGGDFEQDSEITALGATGIDVTLDEGSLETFTGAASSQLSYESGINSLEWNYVVTSRTRRDRAELLPSGEWVRRTNAGWTYHGSFGIRYIDLSEEILWNASDITNTTVAAADGVYRVQTENDMAGPQFGGGLTYESDRFNVTFGGKLGVFANNARSESSLSFADAATGAALPGVGFTGEGDRDHTLSFLGEFKLTGRWHLRPHISLRASYEAWLLTATALAPSQVNFNPGDGIVTVSGDVFYHGISMGIEGYW